MKFGKMSFYTSLGGKNNPRLCDVVDTHDIGPSDIEDFYTGYMAGFVILLVILFF